jgi:predicted DNA-binding transcriptional regulator AlpA
MHKIQQDALIKMLKSKKVAKAVMRAWDRSVHMTLDEKDGKVQVEFHVEDSGLAVMTVADVAAFLQTDRASVRRMTGDRAQRRSHHPIPFVKVGGKMIRFSRPAIEAWWNELCASKNGKSNTSALTLTKGKAKKS